MKRVPSFLHAIVIFVLASSLAASDRDKPAKSPTPLSADEIAVYKAVLRTLGKETSLNVSSKTHPLDPSAQTTGFDRPGCLAGIQLENLSSASHAYHELDTKALPSQAMRIVDPKAQEKIVQSNDPSRTIRQGKTVKDAVAAAFSTGLLSLSEIAFDKEHRFAAVRYRFSCGSLCGHGSTLVLKQVDGEWEKLRECGGWIS